MLILFACNESAPASDAPKTDTPAVDTGKMTIQIPRSACYKFANAADTITLKVETFPNVVTGLLNYTLKEKDKNRGEIEGVMRGDTLVADYSFMSEGTRSVRQVKFLINGDVVTDLSTNLKLSKVDCDY